eukprot:GCRY01004283.1.p1 GENE.GCRY01004283.1~~GCRY01004283.1.p1  ORF type:complete len:656 (-),score=41.69 GCRY01004283.1:63-2030(-)
MSSNKFEHLRIPVPCGVCSDYPVGMITLCEEDLEIIHVKDQRDDRIAKLLEKESSFPHLLVDDNLVASISSTMDNGEKRGTKRNLESSELSSLKKQKNGTAAPDAQIKKSSTLTKFSSAASHFSLFIKWIWNLPDTYKALKTRMKILPSFLPPEDVAIKCFSWHPHTLHLALALSDDSIIFYNYEHDHWWHEVLVHETMKDISSLLWLPNDGTSLAVAGSEGIHLWRILRQEGPFSDIGTSTSLADPKAEDAKFDNIPFVHDDDLPQSSNAAKTTRAFLTFFSFPGLFPVHCLCVHPHLPLLASSSPSNSSIVIWDFTKGEPHPLSRFGSNGITVLQWSPNGDYLLAASTGKEVKIFETKHWTSLTLTLSSACQCACFHPNNRTLFLSEVNGTCVHVVNIKDGKGTSPLSNKLKEELSVFQSFSLSPYITTSLSGSQMVCGIIKSFALDPAGERLVVIFSESEGTAEEAKHTEKKNAHRPLPAVLRVVCDFHDNLSLHPLGFIRGPPDCPSPYLSSFVPKYDNGSLLTLVYPNGKIGFIPFFFTASSLHTLSPFARAQSVLTRTQNEDEDASAYFNMLNTMKKIGAPTSEIPGRPSASVYHQEGFPQNMMPKGVGSMVPVSGSPIPLSGVYGSTPHHYRFRSSLSQASNTNGTQY